MTDKWYGTGTNILVKTYKHFFEFFPRLPLGFVVGVVVEIANVPAVILIIGIR